MSRHPDKPSPVNPGTLLSLLALMMVLIACEPRNAGPDPDGRLYSKGVFIVNEGQFTATNASLSFYDPLKDSVYNHIFYAANQVPLGDIALSFHLHDENAYLVVNNSGKIYRVNRSNMEFRGKITGLHSPRYMVITESLTPKAYVSDLYSGRIMVVDPLNDRITDSIDISDGGLRKSTEQLLLHENKLYAACWSWSNQVLVIDTKTDRIIDSIEVGMQPNSMVLDKNGDLWVLSDGGYPFSPAGQEKASLTRIDLETNSPRTMKTWEDIRVSPIDLCINPGGDSLFFIGGGVYKLSLDMNGFEQALIPDNGRQFYSLGIDPGDGTIYIGDAVDYQQDGWVYRYTPRGAAIDSFRVGVNPGYFWFWDQGN